MEEGTFLKGFEIRDLHVDLPLALLIQRTVQRQRSQSETVPSWTAPLLLLDFGFTTVYPRQI